MTEKIGLNLKNIKFLVWNALWYDCTFQKNLNWFNIKKAFWDLRKSILRKSILVLKQKVFWEKVY